MLKNTIADAMKDAMRAHEKEKTATLRLIMSEMKALEINSRNSADPDFASSDQAVEVLLTKMVKQRRDSIAAYQKGDRPDLIEKEVFEVAVIEAFLPQKMTDDQLQNAINQAIEHIGASGVKDMGAVMEYLKSKHASAMDMSTVGKLVKQRLL